MSEFYTVRRNTLVQVGNYTNVDEAEIVKVMTGKDAVVITQELDAEFEQGRLYCHESNGEFTIQNEKCETLCTLKVSIEAYDCSCWVDSTESIDRDLSEEYYHIYINSVEIDDTNLTYGLKRDIMNQVDSFIGTTNEKNR